MTQPLTEAERREAETIKYGPTILMLIPLSTGRFAVMGAGRQLGPGSYAPTACLEELEAPQPEVRRSAGRLHEILPTADPELNLEIEL